MVDSPAIVSKDDSISCQGLINVHDVSSISNSYSDCYEPDVSQWWLTDLDPTMLPLLNLAEEITRTGSCERRHNTPENLSSNE